MCSELLPMPKIPMDSDYDKFMDWYHDEHEVCPKCGSEKCLTGLTGFILHMDRKDEYKDLNKSSCMDCGYEHTVHDRIRKNPKFEEIEL